MSANYLLITSSPIEKPLSNAVLFSGLGKATRRGVKKCFKCSTYNGTRGTFCKNKSCGIRFKESLIKPKTITIPDQVSVRLITGTSRRIFSVRMHDEDAASARGFVQLPEMHYATEFLSDVALCFVDTCQRLFDNSILKCHEQEESAKSHSVCVHIQSALRNAHEAFPLETKALVLDSLNVTDDTKRKLLTMTGKTEGPLVQRISKSMFAVQCQTSSKHPLGYLHLSLLRGKRKSDVPNYVCGCVDRKGNRTDDPNKEKCLHYFACIWSFVSNSKLSEEFTSLINREIKMGIISKKPLSNLLSSDGI